MMAASKLTGYSFWFQHRNSLIGSLVQQFSAGSVFFDVDGGNGFVAKALQDAGITSVLVEPGGQGVVNGRNRGIEHLVESMWSPEIVRPECVEAVGLFNVVQLLSLRIIGEYLGRSYLNVNREPQDTVR
jgi:hypothetical protein